LSRRPGSDTVGRAAGCNLDRFSFFFAFYGLILGLAVTELLGGFARLVRARAVNFLEPQTALIAILTFIVICATWVDAWDSLQTITLSFEALAAPILLATFYYLAAAVVFPTDPADFPRIATYFAERKKFMVAMLFAAEIVEAYTFSSVYIDRLQHHPAVFWLWLLPYNIAIKGSFIALLFVRSRRANIALLSTLILLFLIPYWERGAIVRVISNLFGPV
jgi:hypothetical protein